ncbi:glycosyltransferase family 4 protein [Methylocystis sp. JAN1]|uniref:glycosyltransferase family 4 protein n=1 Tax=Methylocystis sp. JAN1 TaxID=3397211 RepID=UPI003FA2DE54
MAAADEQDAREHAAALPGLRVLHVMRAPVGGLFRHVADLTRAQAASGCHVGVVADSLTGGEDAARILGGLSPHLALGVTRLPMRRLPHPDDLRIAWRVAALVRELQPHIIHGHGAKGGLYARLPAVLPIFPQPASAPARVYTPHGGSLHFRPDSPLGRIFFTAELIMGRVTDLMPFESDYARRRFSETVEPPRALAPVVHNGLSPQEFAPVAPAPGAADFVFIGEMRVAKGVEDLLHAFAALPGDLRLALAGSGLDEAQFRTLAHELGLADRVAFHPRTPTREALAHGKILVVPSRAESLPYIVLEAIAAKTPVVSTRVGGIPEIFGSQAARLAPPRDPAALAAAMRAMHDMSPQARMALAEEMADFVKTRFTIDRMNEGVLGGYRAALSRTPRLAAAGSAH